MKVTPEHLALIKSKSADWLASVNLSITDIDTPAKAHTVLHKSGAYRAMGDEHPSGYPDYTDAHLRTALKAAFPGAF